MNKNVETVQLIYAAVGRGDLDFILGQIDEDATWAIESVAEGEVPAYGLLRGKANIPKFFAGWAESGEFKSFEPHDFVAAGDHVFCHLRYEFAVKATGKVIKNFSLNHW